MERASFVFTILFLLLGPIKVIPGFHHVMQGTDARFKRDVALKATLLASAVVALVVLLGRDMVDKYEIHLDAVRLATGLVLLISALKTMFPGPAPQPEARTAAPAPRALEIAASPLAMPIIVTPAGVAALLVFIMIAPLYPGLALVIPAVLVPIMALNFLAMFFNDRIVKLPGLLLALHVLGFVMVFIQVALAIETIVAALRDLHAA